MWLIQWPLTARQHFPKTSQYNSDEKKMTSGQLRDMALQSSPQDDNHNLVTKWHNHKQDDSFPSFCGYWRGDKASAPRKLLENERRLDEAYFPSSLFKTQGWWLAFEEYYHSFLLKHSILLPLTQHFL